MYSQEDINSAVAAGAISAESAQALRSHVAAVRDAVPADAEHFRLITGFNDIFVTIGVIIMLFAMGAIGQAVAGAIWPLPVWNEAATADWYENTHSQRRAAEGMGLSLAALFVAVTAWFLAEFFTRKRRMALPSIILLLAFVIGVMVAQAGVLMAVLDGGDDEMATGFALLAGAALITAGFAWLHWRRFMVPITIAAGTAALTATAILLLLSAIGPDASNVDTVLLVLAFVAGLVIFAFAMRWDISDPARETRRSDVAFWLHLLAAPLIAHPVFALIGVTDGDNIGAGAALAVLAVYVVFGIIALAVDRRALLVSALAYVLFSLTYLFQEFGAVELSVAFTALVIGSALLSLSALWTPIRRAVVGALPGGLSTRLPATA